MFSADTEHIYVPGPAENIVWLVLSYDKFWCIICSPLPNVLHSSGEHMTCSNLTNLENKWQVQTRHTFFVRTFSQTSENIWQLLTHHMFSTTKSLHNSGEHMTDSNPSYFLPYSGKHKTCFKLLYVLQCNGHRTYMTSSNPSYIFPNRAEAVTCTPSKVVKKL